MYFEMLHGNFLNAGWYGSTSLANLRLSELTDELSRYAAATFEENDLITLGGKVEQIQQEAGKLYALYAGDRAKEIRDREAEVLNEWRNLQKLCDSRKRQLNDYGDLYKFFNMSRDLMMWMDTQMHQMRNVDKPRDVSGVELLLNNHQSLKAEIDARAENFTICLNLGKDLINRRHPRGQEVGSFFFKLGCSRLTKHLECY